MSWYQIPSPFGDYISPIIYRLRSIRRPWNVSVPFRGLYISNDEQERNARCQTSFRPLSGTIYLQSERREQAKGELKSFRPLSGTIYLQSTQVFTTVQIVPVSVPFRGLYISNIQDITNTTRLEEFPSPFGDYISPIRKRNLHRRRKRFPSPFGDYISPIFTVTLAFKGEESFRPLSGTIYLQCIYYV